MRNAHRVFLILVALAAASAGCGGSAQQQEEQQEAALFGGVAAGLQVVQTARSQAPPTQPSEEGQCCTTCRWCEFPCGNKCVPYGTVCVSPKGCACYDVAIRADATTGEPVRPVGCPVAGE